MGYGDELMVSGEVKKLLRPTVRRFAVYDARKGGRHRWNEVWENNPHIVRPGQFYDARYYNHGGARPYIEEKGAQRWFWKEYAPEPGMLFLQPFETAGAELARDRVVINPSIKAGASPNKRWSGWERLVSDHPEVPWVQLGGGEEIRFPGVPYVSAPSFRHACGILSGARAIVCHEGGLHHAAAALGVPAVVIFGGYIGPRVTGYVSQRNLFHETEEYPLGCGMRVGCPHCADAMRAISPNRVHRELEALLTKEVVQNEQ